MRFTQISGAALAAASLALAKEMPKDEQRAAKLYDSGVMHQRSMARKKAAWLQEKEMGLLDSREWPRLNYTKCENGKAEAIAGDPLHTFRCKNMDLYDFINHATLGSPNGWNNTGRLLTGSSSWGWTDPKSKREFVANGMYDGTAFLEILPEGRLEQLGFLPCPAPTDPDAFWKELRSYNNYMLIGSELTDHGVQIFDMEKLLDIKHGSPVLFDIEDDVHGHFLDLPEGASHNVVSNPEAGYIVAVGSRPRNSGCNAGLIFIDMEDPANPTRLGECNGEDGYVHDAQCIIYHGPDERYEGHDICYGYNEDTLTIYDVTDKSDTKILSITSYEGATYTHQGWVLDPEWQEYLLMDDEIDEIEEAGPAGDQFPVTYIWNIADLENPKQTGLYKGTVKAVDHNQYIKDGLSYQSNYCAGVRIYDVSSIPDDPTGDSVCEIAYLDIYPEDDDLPGGGQAEMFGSWSHYAMFESGYVFINTIERGAFLGKMTKRESCPKKKSCNADNCLRAMRATTISGRLEESQEFCADFTDGWNADVQALPKYASDACKDNPIARVSSACSCLPAPTAAP